MPLILPGNVASATAAVGYDVANSLRFNRGDEPILSRTQSTSPTDDDKCTMSLWFKPGAQTATGGRGFSFGGSTDVNSRWHFYVETDAELYYYGKLGGSVNMTLNSTNKYRDPSAWYHYVVAIDTTQGTAANRVRSYINNVEVTSWIASTYPSQNDNCPLVKDANMLIGAIRGGSYQLYNWTDGYLSEVHFIDGLQLTPASFAEYDEDSPTIWKPKDCKADLTYGTNGFYLEFKDSSALGDDTSGNSNDFTVTNLDATDQATDTPTNNFCTINPLAGYVGSYVFSQGNCQIAQNAAYWHTRTSTMAVTKGKWYWEVELDAGTMIEIMVGFHDTSTDIKDINAWLSGSMVFYNDAGGEFRIDGVQTTADYGVLTAGDILGFALNMDDKELTLYDNGSAIATDVSIGSNINEATPSFISDATNVVFKANFGGCSAFTVSSANQDGNGYGNFEYAVPSGYYALCTKNLAEYG